MRLTDKIELWEAEIIIERGEEVLGPFEFKKVLRTNVSYQTVNRSTEAGQDLFIEKMNCILEPMDFNPKTMRLMWRGKTYSNAGPPMLRMKKGKVHHLTVPLQEA